MDLLLPLLLVVLSGAAVAVAAWLTHRRLHAPPVPPAPGMRSKGGQPVRSRGELLIANYLEDRGIRYEYEPKVAGFTPDFLLRDTRVIVEYWGLIGRYRKYDRKVEEKRERYKREGYRVIGLTPRHVQRLDQTLGMKLKKHYPERFRDL